MALVNIYSFEIDINGNWIGTSQFRFSEAIYELDLIGFNISSLDQYRDMMETFYSETQRIGQVAKSNPLPYNMLRWTAHSAYYSVELRALTSQRGDQRFQMTGSPAQVFDLSLKTARVLGPLGYGNCSVLFFGHKFPSISLKRS
jgi:hypothetical protein